jgi:CubicO group peptidase (beta-lactamase class C family)
MNDDALQTLLDNAAKELGVVGAQLAIFDGKQVREFSTGHRHQELELPTTTSTLFQIGSTTKVFNAAVVMSLVDSGVLDLDTPVTKYIPDFRLASWDAQQTITLRHLLSMSAGLDNGSYHEYGRGDDALDRYVEALAGVPHLFKPGTAFGYSNASTNVSGHAAACATSKTWESLLQDRILTPLSLTQSATFAEDLLHHPVAVGYTRKALDVPAERVAGWALPRSMAPAGGTLCCSAGDLVRFARMFLDNGRSSAGTQVLSANAVRTMHTPQVTLPTELMAQKWCAGPYYKKWGGFEIFGHSGTNLGGSSMLLWCLEKNVAIATVVNVAAQGYPLADRIFNVVFPQLFGIDKPANPDLDSIKAATVDLKPFAGKFEALGNTITFNVRDGKLIATVDSEFSRMLGLEAIVESELVPLGGMRFAPRNPELSGNRMWDVAFWSETADGRPTHFLNGMFANRRVGG